MIRKAALASPLAVAVAVALHATGLAAFDPYASGALGYDFSYPQCGAAAPQASFGIVGVNGGGTVPHHKTRLSPPHPAAGKKAKQRLPSTNPKNPPHPR